MTDQRKLREGQDEAMEAAGRIPPVVHFAVERLPDVRLITDSGRAIGLWRYEIVALPQGSHGDWISKYGGNSAVLEYFDQDFRKNCNRDVSSAIRVFNPTIDCNCHGWIFAGGRFGVGDEDVPAILQDNDYQPADNPGDGDLAVYWTNGHPSHSGIVRISAATGVQLIESKWGPFSVYLHLPAVHPFRGECCFYRTNRGGHANMVVASGEKREKDHESHE